MKCFLSKTNSRYNSTLIKIINKTIICLIVTQILINLRELTGILQIKVLIIYLNKWFQAGKVSMKCLYGTYFTEMNLMVFLE